jgi:uncharacterized repeat protein (TIGR01451 family)
LALVLALGTPVLGQSRVSPEIAHLEAIKVKLAWLGDRSTFECILGAHVDDSFLRLCGRVPSEEVHRRAVLLAQHHTALPIVDALEVNAKMIRRLPGEGSAESLQRSAIAILQRTFGEHSRGFRVTALPNGVVVVAGTAGSYEEILSVSQSLRLLNPCACVDNRLTVATVARDGMYWQLVTGDGRFRLPAAAPLTAANPTPRTSTPVVSIPVRTIGAAPDAGATDQDGAVVVRPAFSLEDLPVYARVENLGVQLIQSPMMPAMMPANADLAGHSLPPAPGEGNGKAELVETPTAEDALFAKGILVAFETRCVGCPSILLACCIHHAALACMTPGEPAPIQPASLKTVAAVSQTPTPTKDPGPPVPAKVEAPPLSPIDSGTAGRAHVLIQARPAGEPGGQKSDTVASREKQAPKAEAFAPELIGPSLDPQDSPGPQLDPVPQIPSSRQTAAGPDLSGPESGTVAAAPRQTVGQEAPAATLPRGNHNAAAMEIRRLPAEVKAAAQPLVPESSTSPGTLCTPPLVLPEAPVVLPGVVTPAVYQSPPSASPETGPALSPHPAPDSGPNAGPGKDDTDSSSRSSAEAAPTLGNVAKLCGSLAGILLLSLVCLVRVFKRPGRSDKDRRRAGSHGKCEHPASPVAQPEVGALAQTAKEPPAASVQPTVVCPDENVGDRLVRPRVNLLDHNGSPRPEVQAGECQEPAVSVRWVGPKTAKLGKPVMCQICARNISPGSVQRVVVRYRLSSGVAVRGTDPQAEREGDVLCWQLGALQPGQEKRIDLELLPETTGDLNCEAQVNFMGSCVMRMCVREPRLALKVSAPAQVSLGQAVTIQLAVANNGDGMAENVKVKACLPEGLEHSGSRNLVMELGNLGPQETRTVQLICVTRAGGALTCQAQATADGELTAQDAAIVDVVLPQLKLTVSGPKLRYIDRRATYLITVTNPGSAPASNVSIGHQFPPGFRFHGASAGGRYDASARTVSWFVGDLLPGHQHDVTLELVAVEAGAHPQHTTVVAADGLRADHELVTTVEGVSVLDMQVIDLDDPVEVGAETGYEIHLTNAGSRVETEVGLVCTIPPAMEFRDAAGVAGGRFRVDGADIIFEPLLELAPRAIAVYRVKVRGLAAGDHLFRARLSAHGMEQALVREERTKVYGDL